MKALRQLIGILFIIAALAGVALSQTRDAAQEPDAKTESPSQELLREVRLTRKAIDQLKKQLIQLETLAIQIRLQQDSVAATEAKIDSIRSEAYSIDEPLAQLRDRVRKLEAAGSPTDEDEQRRAELQETRKEIERQQQRLDLLRSQEVQLTTQLQMDKARLDNLLSRLEVFSGELGNTQSESPTPRTLPTGSPNN